MVMVQYVPTFEQHIILEERSDDIRITQDAIETFHYEIYSNVLRGIISDIDKKKKVNPKKYKPGTITKINRSK